MVILFSLLLSHSIFRLFDNDYFETPVCKWDNIECDGEKVVKIDLKGARLDGTLPTELGKVHSLKELILEDVS